MNAYSLLRWLVPFLAVLSLTGCTEEYKKKIEQLKAQLIEHNIDSQRREAYIVDSLELKTRHTLAQIDAELLGVLEGEGILINEEQSLEERIDRKTKILDRINDFQTVIDQNKNKISNLLLRLNKTENQNKELIATLQRTQIKLKEQEERFKRLAQALKAEQEKVYALEASFMDLKRNNDSLVSQLDTIDSELHKAFYIVGDFRDLKASGVVEKEGGILSIGSTHVLRDNLNEKAFNKLDTRERIHVPIKARKAELISTHPQDSYTFTSDGEEIAALEITNPGAFWKASKYMVIETR